MPEGQTGATCENLWKKMIGKPYSGKLNVRFDEGELEIELLAIVISLDCKNARTMDRFSCLQDHMICNITARNQDIRRLFTKRVPKTVVIREDKDLHGGGQQFLDIVPWEGTYSHS